MPNISHVMLLQLFTEITECAIADFVSLFSFSCLDKGSSPVICLKGNYSPLGIKDCLACPLGAECPQDGLTSYRLCTNGSFATSVNQTSCQSCPAGYKCSNPTQEPMVCENGTYSRIGASQCTECPSGYR